MRGYLSGGFFLLCLFMVNFNVSAAEQKEAVKSLDYTEEDDVPCLYAEGYKDNDRVLLKFSEGVVETCWGTLCPNGYDGYFKTVRSRNNLLSFAALEEGINVIGHKFPCLFIDFDLKCFRPILSALQCGEAFYVKQNSRVHKVAVYLGYDSYFREKFPEKLTFFEIKGVRFDFVKIKAGKYMMGSQGYEGGSSDDEVDSDDGEEGNSNDEKRRLVEVEEFFMGKFPVTQEQYEAVTGKNPSWHKGALRPVESVSYYDVESFIVILNRLLEEKGLTGNIRLPDEEEWEYAARGGTTTAYWWGNDVSKEHCWYSDKCNYTRSVGADGHENPYGLSDMLGNVHEWTASIEEGVASVLRGGCYKSSASHVASGFRRKAARLWEAKPTLGFRLVRSN